MEELKNYEGNESEFIKYNEILKKDFKGTILYHDNKNKKYFGNIINNLYEGRGILYDESGEIIFDGFFKNGKYEGFGKLYNKKELKYEGFFSNDKYEGKGNLYYNNSKIYEGHFHEGEKHGIGIILINGKKLRKLFFENGKESSNGILYDNNNEIYSGEILENKPKNGKNITIYNNNGNKEYKGDFLNFEYHGKGILYFDDIDKIYFQGIFENGKFIDGKLYDLEGKVIYKGKFIDEKPIKGKNIKLYDLNKNLIYDGDFKNGIFSGFGKLYKKNNLYYDGDFKNGIFSGFGKLYKNNNLYYEGNFEKGEIRGKGIKYYRNGNKHIEGDFETENKYEEFNFLFKRNYAEGILYDINGNRILKSEFNDFIPLKGENKILYISDKYILFDDDIYNNKYNGKGKLYERITGEYILKYEGKFLDGNIFGNGIKFYKNGQKKFEGNFQLNEIFEGIYYSPKGNIIFKGKIDKDYFYDSKILEIYNDDGYLLYKGKIENNEKKVDNIQILKDVIFCRDKILDNYYIDMKLNWAMGKISFISENHSGRTAIIKRLINNEFFSELNKSYSIDFYSYNYMLNNTKYILQIWNLCGAYNQNKEIYRNYINIFNILIYVVDLSRDIINEEIINFIYENNEKSYKFIYLVISKIDINKENKSKLESSRNFAKKLILEGSIYRYFELSSKTEEGFDEFKKCLKFDSDLSLKLDLIEKKKHQENSCNFNNKLNKYLNY